jgi:hypothetical protein
MAARIRKLSGKTKCIEPPIVVLAGPPKSQICAIIKLVRLLSRSGTRARLKPTRRRAEESCFLFLARAQLRQRRAARRANITVTQIENRTQPVGNLFEE